MKKNTLGRIFAASLVASLVFPSHASANPTSVTWTVWKGSAKDIGASGHDTLWAIGTNVSAGGASIYHFNNSSNEWSEFGGLALHVDVDGTGKAWVVNENGAVFQRVGSGWQHAGGLVAKDIGVGFDGSVWAIGGPAHNGGFGIHRWTGSAWSEVGGGAARIDVDAKGNPWVVNDSGAVFRRVGNDWQHVAGLAAKDIGVGQDGSVWAIGGKDYGGGNFGVHKWTGSGWQEVGGAGVRISADDWGRPWIVNTAGQIFVGGLAQVSAGVAPPSAPEAPAPATAARKIQKAIEVAPEPEPTSGDPVDFLIPKAPSAKAFLEPLRGVFQIDSVEQRNPGDHTQLAKIKGTLDWKRGMGTLNKPSSNRLNNPFKDMSGGSIHPSAIHGGAIVPVSNQKVAVAALAKNVSALAEKLNTPNPMPVEITLISKNGELDLEVTFQLSNTYRTTGVIVPAAGTVMALREVNLKLHAKMNLKAERQVSAELEGKMFVKPTSRDPWIGVTPVVEPDSTGAVTFGGDFTGACGSDPTPTTDPSSCRGEWDVLKMGLVRSTGGVLKVTVEGGSVTGVEAAIQNGKLGPNNVPVDGAVLGDADMTPGAGLVLKTKGSPGLKDTLAWYRPITKHVEPLRQLLDGVDKLPVPNIGVEQDSEIVITPTGLTVGHIDIPQPTIFANIKAKALGNDITIRSDIKGDPAKILSGDAAAIDAIPTGYLEADTRFTTINDVVNQIPLVKSTFNVRGAVGRVDIKTTTRTTTARLDFHVFGKDKSTTIPLFFVLDPNALGLIAKGLFELKCADHLEQGGGLCYPKCRAGFEGDGATLCKGACPEGYRVEPLTCMRDLHVYGNGCKGNCGEGYTNDGCTCRRPPHSVSRETYSRGAGEVMKLPEWLR